MLKFAVFLIITSLVCSVKGDKLDDMPWEPGDLITCKLSGVGGFFGFKHYMIGSDTPRHVITVLNNKGDGRIEDIHQAQFTRGINRSRCRNRGKGKLTREETIERAKRWVGTKFTYNLFRCNCQHWTNDWTKGSSGRWYNNQSLRPSARYCPI
ncbi:uncharacterized protein LOC123316932 [Coccinella septempunctata]|uniref:uncharacterized protein LOC123316932 n=1 Tax=Coccinella septempunctata TaxID=41139 RepID=UPI001D0801BF|nr:uncharacterized protein LOC123316932 [Coccinella septempunctata]